MSEMLPQCRIELHGWDADTSAWFGPDDIEFRPSTCRRLCRKLQETPGSWHGVLRSRVPGESPWAFRASFHDLTDAGLGTLDLDGSPGGPQQIVLVVPACCRARVRPELAFEFASYLRFLEGPESKGTELAIHDRIQSALDRSDARATLVFSIETRPIEPEVRVHLAQQAEKLITAMAAALSRNEPQEAIEDADLAA